MRSIPDGELAKLDAMGVRGIRINTSPIKSPEPNYARNLLPRVERLSARCAEIGWQLDFLNPAWLTTELFDCFRNLRVNFTLAHMGMYFASQGTTQPGFRQLLDLLKNGNGRAWIKITGAYRISTRRDFADVAPMAHALIEAAPNRIIWE